MSRREAGILSALALLMVLLVIFDPWQRSSEPVSPRLLASYDNGELSSISLADGSAVYAGRRDGEGTWIATAPRQGAADANAISRLRSALPLLRSLRHSKEQSVRGTSTGNLALTLVFGGASPVVIHIGAITPNGKSRWVRVGDDSYAHLVESHLVAEILADVKSLRSPLVVSWALSTAEPVRVSSEGRWLEIKGETLRWFQNGGPSVTAIADAVRAQHWLENLAVLAESGDDDCEHPPELRIEQGASSVQVSPAMCLEPASLANVLAVHANPEQLARMSLFPTRRPEADFTIRCGDSQRSIAIRDVNQKALWTWWQGWDTAARKLIERQDLGTVCTFHGSDWEVVIGKREGAWFAKSPHADFDFALASDSLPALEPLSELFLSPLLIEEDAAFLRRVEFVDRRGRRVLERNGETGAWALSGAGLSEGQVSEWAALLTRTLGTLQTVGEPNKASRTASGERVLKLVVEFESALGDAINRYEIELGGSARACTAAVGGRPPASLSPDDCAVLLRQHDP